MTATSEWAPTTDDVGALLRARTKDTNGNELGTFTDKTRPTGTQVESMIARAAEDLADSSATDLPERLYGSARRLIVYVAACDVELSYYPEQVATGRSPYAQYREIVTERRAALLKAWADDTGASTDAPGDGVTPDGGPPLPVGGFPVAALTYLEDGSVRSFAAEHERPRPYVGPTAAW